MTILIKNSNNDNDKDNNYLIKKKLQPENCCEVLFHISQ